MPKLAVLALLWFASAAGAQGGPGQAPILPPVTEPPRAAHADWTHISTPDFSLDFPAKVAVKEVKSDAGGAPFVLFTYQVIIRGALYMVSYIDYPLDRFQSAVPREVLDHARDAAVAGVNGKLQTESEVTLKSSGPQKTWPGRQVDSLTADGFPVKARLYLVANRLYQLIVVYPKGPVDTKGFERMASSLHVTK